MPSRIFLPGPDQIVLFTEQECSYRQDYARYLQQHKFFPNNVLETASVEAIKKYVINGLGVSYLPYYAVQEEAKAGLLEVKIPPTDMRLLHSDRLSPEEVAFPGHSGAH